MSLDPGFSRDFCSDPIIGLRVRPATHIILIKKISFLKKTPSKIFSLYIYKMYCKSVGDPCDPCDPLSVPRPTTKYAATQFWVATHGLRTQGLDSYDHGKPNMRGASRRRDLNCFWGQQMALASISGKEVKMCDFTKQKWPCILTCNLDASQVKNQNVRKSS